LIAFRPLLSEDAVLVAATQKFRFSVEFISDQIAVLCVLRPVRGLASPIQVGGLELMVTTEC
jgi:hypothetical protein